GISDANKRIQHGFNARRSVQSDAPFGELNRKCCRMRPLFLMALNRFVGNEPCVPAATQILSASMRPTRDVALILIRHAKRQPVQFDAARLCEMKNVFMTIIEKSRRIDRLEMTKSLEATFDLHPALRVRLSLVRERIKVRVGRLAFFFDHVD